MSNKEIEIKKIEARISLLQNRPSDSQNIIRKLQRRLRNLTI